MLKSNGIISILQVTVDGSIVANQGNPHDWRRYEALTKLISTCPMQVKSADEYCRNICTQIRQMLHYKKTNIPILYLRISLQSIILISQKYPKLTKKYFFQPILRPFILCLRKYEQHSSEDIPTIFSEKSITTSVVDIHKVLLNSNDIPFLSKHLFPIIHPLFICYSFSKNTISHLSPILSEIFVTILNEIETRELLSYIVRIAYGEAAINEPNSGDYSISDRIQFALGTEGGIQVKVAKVNENLTEDEFVDSAINYRQQMFCFLELLTILKRNDIIGDLIVKLLSNLLYITNRLQSCTESVKLESDISVDVNFNRFLRFKAATLYLLGAICGTVDTSTLLKNKDQILDFVMSTVERATNGLEDERKEDYSSNGSRLFEETINISMLLLSIIIGDKKMISENDWERLQRLLPSLEQLTRLLTSSYISQTANNLRICLATRSEFRSWSELQKGEADPPLDLNHSCDPDHSKVYCSHATDKNTRESENDEESNREQERSNFKSIMAELEDPLIPIRGAGLVHLAKLITKKDPEVTENITQIETIIRTNLEDSDSYVYLAAINALVALTDIEPDLVLPRLCKEFINASENSEDGNPSAKYEFRMKLGESLQLAIKHTGELLPRYAHHIIPAVLTGVNDKDSDIRCSSLSQLAELCMLLRHSINPLLHEVTSCISSLAKFDKINEVRRGAVNVIRSLLKGLQSDIIEVI
ncbi:uncharacterized protein TRIADDRAFT_52476 [Trichoplax adhaerens]|uniref:Uncharacterized protein n=1 Tax=Trichoplax adhaerens TaxID=10228 RepID=B3RIP3_TRIAD|nr:hypothetical protein TRIADDRAFT_52476 [Trichoplax adhaerens]EDV29755.1 hypothetical protein TRIADDRAFT_52476 [Trichoplax adhaerens]|eukprot:XP_002108957.1 hypothetical protein TRIADDRAFT_52476 [Trichoplax adhaerens]